jgi:hypothetical protein
MIILQAIFSQFAVLVILSRFTRDADCCCKPDAIVPGPEVFRSTTNPL